MGFYSIATIVEDAKRQGVEMRPVDVQRSAWDCTMEEGQEGQVRAGGAGRVGSRVGRAGGFAVRMGLRFVKGFGETSGQRIVAAREDAPFASLADMARRTRLDERALTAVADAGAFEAMAVERRSALWDVPGVVRDARLSLSFDGADDGPAFQTLEPGETIAWDYRSSSHSVRGHPLASLRPALRQQGIPDARTVQTLLSGTRVRYAGLVICRQRPVTASNVTFMTLEDETGFVNLVLWDRVFQAFAVLARTAHWLGVTGTIEAKQGVVHLIAQRLWVPRAGSVAAHSHSRDFH
jgi:error-prone DNA polymerase